MPKDHSADLMQALTAKLYTTVTGDDDAIKLPRNKFVSWYMPGLPFLPQDFLYCAKGLDGATAEEIKERFHQAFVVSRLFDYVPDVSKEFVTDEMQQTMMASTQDTISSVYHDILNYSKVYHKELSDKQKEKLAKFRNLLSVTKKITDLVTDEEKEVTEPGKLMLAYTQYMNNYLQECDEYMNVKIAAQSATGDDPEAKRRVYEWASKERFLRKKMEAAYLAWAAQGYMNEYTEITAYINQVTSQSMVLYKQDLLFKLDKALQNSVTDGGSDFYYTTLIPGNFATSPGWTKFEYYEGDFESHYKKKTSAWSAGGGGFWGLFSIGAKASGSKVEVSQNQKSTKFRAKFEFTQVPIIRPWFEPGFFSMRAWTLGDLWNLNYPGVGISDGNSADKPVGRLVAYPIHALFVRNVEFSFDEADAQFDYVKKQSQVGGSVGWGPFRVGGSYSRGEEQRDLKSHCEGGKITIEGLQLVGTVNNLVPKCPDTNPALKPGDFVGGE